MVCLIGLPNYLNRARAADEFQTCLESLWPPAAEHGVSRESFETATSELKPDPDVLRRLDAQPEFVLTIWNYLDKLVSLERVERGRAMLVRYRPEFDDIEKVYNVDRYVLAAIWGVETNYGTEMGQWPVLTATATLACNGRRQDYFRDEFIAALTILEHGDIKQSQFKGSWSGAFGQTQMMPTSYETLAVDFDHDGRRDIVNSVPDALASAANYLKWHGWSSAAAWGSEVSVPDGFDFSIADGQEPKTVSDWAQLDVRAATGEPLARTGEKARLFIPAGALGPAFLTLNNYDVILSYNPAHAYALAVVHLSDRLRGAGSFRHPWPRQQRALTPSERSEIRERLVLRGFANVGSADNLSVRGTRRAIRHFQASVGMIADGYPSAAILDRLRSP